MSKKRTYYSVRTGKNPNSNGFGLSTLNKLFLSLYLRLDDQGYFQENFGKECVDAGLMPGVLGRDIESVFMMNLRKENLWPIPESTASYEEDDLFDVIEFLYDHVSAGVEGYYHGYAECGWHYETFDQEEGQRKYRVEVNKLLNAYKGGFELHKNGEILSLPEEGYENLLTANLPNDDPENIETKVRTATYNFRRARSSLDDRRNAIRELADVLEFLRPRLKEVLTKEDESDLFNIANNFGIRHHNTNQKTNYDKPIWYAWLFYYYLSTIHASLRLIEKAKDKNSSI